jgi:hypothetical protein
MSTELASDRPTRSIVPQSTALQRFPPYSVTFKLRGPESASELNRLIDRHLSTKFSANFYGQSGDAWLAQRILYGR